MLQKSECFNKIVNEYADLVKDIIVKIKKAENIAVIGHLEPDGDSVGAQLSFADALKSNGWSADAVSRGPFDNRFLKSHKKYFKRNIDKKYDLFLILDTPSKDRIGELSKEIDYENAVVIDHHVTNTKFGRINWVSDKFLSTSEMVFIILKKMNIGLEDKKICQYLLNGIVSDSGFFMHIRKDKYLSLLISFYLIDNGADPNYSYNIMYGDRTLASKKILALALKRIKSCVDGKILWTYITDKDKNHYGNPIVDTANIFREMMSIENVEIAIYFKVSKKKISVSFRSKDNVNVAILAKSLGGGGHKSASGLTTKGKFEEIKDHILSESIDYIK